MTNVASGAPVDFALVQTPLGTDAPEWSRVAGARREVDAPSIDWTPVAVPEGKRAAAVSRAGPVAVARGDTWQSRFVNHLGVGSERLNPNAQLRVEVPLAPRLTTL